MLSVAAGRLIPEYHTISLAHAASAFVAAKLVHGVSALAAAKALLAFDVERVISEALSI
jgi:hypothetical protein